MTIKTTYGGHTITDLRRWAKDLADAGYPIRRRSTMAGDALYTAVIDMNLLMLKGKEQRVRTALGGISIGTVFAMECGCVLKATSQPETHEAGTSFVHAEYLSACDNCGIGTSLSRLNENAERFGYRFFLWNMKPERVATPEPSSRDGIAVGDIVRYRPGSIGVEREYTVTGIGPISKIFLQRIDGHGRTIEIDVFPDEVTKVVVRDAHLLDKTPIADPPTGDPATDKMIDDAFPLDQRGPVLRASHASDCGIWLGHFSRATWSRCTCTTVDPTHQLDGDQS